MAGALTGCGGSGPSFKSTDITGADFGRELALTGHDGKPRTLAEISAATGDPQASVSARLRDLRKEKFGGYIVTRTYIADGIFTYALGA